MAQFSQNIAILGAGITGLVNAYVLSRAGFSVVLYDPAGFPAKNASYKAGGMLAPYAEIEHMDLGWVAAGLKSIQLWADLQGDLRADFDFHQKGSLLVAHAEDRYILERFRGHLPDGAGESVNPAELESALAGRFGQGLSLPDEAHLHPQKVMAALCEALTEHIEFKQEAVEPEDISADFVIDCRGMGAVQDDPDLRGVKGELAVVHNPDFTLERPVRLMHPRYPLYIVPRGGGIFMIGATVIESEDDAHVSVRSSMELMSALYSLHPSFGEAKVLEFTAGIRPSYAGNLPRIKRAGRVISCNGMFRHGYLFAPVMADCVAGIISEECAEFLDLFIKDGRHDQNHHQRAA